MWCFAGLTLEHASLKFSRADVAGVHRWVKRGLLEGYALVSEFTHRWHDETGGFAAPLGGVGVIGSSDALFFGRTRHSVSHSACKSRALKLSSHTLSEKRGW